ncbi:uncharacterized protein G2W53_003359 [Senna tora]|uniref:Uncharacterized protein n=1 Tax=Senna tora TaxID=362788 RepID=A0A835CFP2_9FABA|nr:uncharacterized protein G2W53_003359 [Senna tora]
MHGVRSDFGKGRSGLALIEEDEAKVLAPPHQDSLAGLQSNLI